MDIIYNGSSCRLQFDGDLIWLLSLYTEPMMRRQKSATMVLRIAKRIAANHSLPLCLFASGFNDRPMSNKKLCEFYSRNGFSYWIKEDSTQYFIYERKL